MSAELRSEIRLLHLKINEKRVAFIDGLKKDSESRELRKIYADIKVLVVRLQDCCKQIVEG